MATAVKSEAEIRADLAQVQLEEAQLRLEQTREDVAKTKAKKFEQSRLNAQRQSQLSSEVTSRYRATRKCNHRQGATPKRPGRGKGPSALNVVKMPDGFTRLIMCSAGCRLRFFSPHPRNAAKGFLEIYDREKNAKRKETQQERRTRLRQYHADDREHKRLIKMIEEHSLTDESATEMDCGNVIETIDGETGQRTLRDRPCDSQPRAKESLVRDDDEDEDEDDE